MEHVSLGDKVFYKRSIGRGRPAVVEVVGIFTEVRDAQGNVERVSVDNIAPYVYRPYKRRAAKRTQKSK